MMTTRRSGRQDGSRTPAEPHLRISLAEAQAALDARIAAGHQLTSQAYSQTAEPTVSAQGMLSEIRRKYYTWDEYNYAWLQKNIGESIAQEYRGFVAVVGLASSIIEEIREHDEDVLRRIRKLESIKERLPLWTDETALAAAGVDIDNEGPIFVVHGHNHGRAHEVARVLERATGRDAIILHEQPNEGRTLIEKFEDHAGNAVFAVVLLTGDDEARKAGTGDLKLRGRQNVIFELGFFFGKLGRNRVMVLVDKGVERPSDVDGLVYEVLDNNGAWKQALARELEAAGIAVNHSKIP